MIPSLSSLREQLTVEALDDDQVAVTVVLPASLVKSYCYFLDSLAGFFRTTDRHSTVARALARSKSPSIDQEAETRKSAYRDRLVKSYDTYTAQGLSRNEAIKRISADLRQDNHPWRTIDCIRKTLIDGGRDGRSSKARCLHRGSSLHGVSK